MIINPTRRAILSFSSILTTFFSTIMSQQNLPSWLIPNEQALLEQSIRDDEGISLEELQRTSFQSIRDSIGDSCQVVLIGEATHGTEEFYRIRVDLTKALLEHDGFDAVLCEGDFPLFFDLNRFVGGAPTSRSMSPRTRQLPAVSSERKEQRGAITIDEAMAGLRDRFPEWMWSNNVMIEFVTWLAELNRTRRDSHDVQTHLPVQLLGLDIYSLFRSADEVIDYLVDAGEMRLAHMARKRYSTLNSFRPEPTSYGKAALYDVVPSQADNVGKVLTSLYKQENKLYQIPGNGQELFNALENARVVAAAEAYYRQLSCPADETWNLRDSAFLDTIKDAILYIQKQKRGLLGRRGSKKARVIVWAHNSHVGDAMATEHTARGQYNVGQLCRQVFGKENVYIIGFSGYDGTVRAAQKWGGQDHAVKLIPAIEGSHEYLLHLIAKSRRKNELGFCFRSNSGESHVDMAAQELFSADRIERFVGVCYIPETELQSHYSICNMSKEFDYVFHVDHSNALRVDQVTTSQLHDSSKGEKRYMFLLDKYGEEYEDLFDEHVQEASEG